MEIIAIIEIIIITFLFKRYLKLKKQLKIVAKEMIDRQKNTGLMFKWM